MHKRLPTVCLIMLFCSPHALGEIYKCTGPGGKTQYTDRPCAGEATVITPKSAPRGDMDALERRERQQRLLNAMEEERAAEKRESKKQQADEAKRRRNCILAKDRLRGITEAGRVYVLDSEGNRVVLSDDDRSRATSEARAAVARWCD